MPSTGFTRFNTVESFSGVTQSEAESLRATAAGGSQYSGQADMSTVTDQVILSGITHSVPSNATVVGIEMRIAVRTNAATNCSFQLTPALFETSGTTSGQTTTVLPPSTSGAGTFHSTAGGSTSMHNLSVTGAQVDDIGLIIRTASNSASAALRMMGHDTLGQAGLVISPSINVHYTVPAFGTIDTWNTIPINAAAAPAGTSTVLTSGTTLGTFTFAGQVRQTATTHNDTGGWIPSDPNIVGLLNMSGWANGADASAAFDWKPSSNNNTPSIRSSQEAADWFMGPNTTNTQRGTASADTGPPSGVDVNNLPSSLASSSAVDNATRLFSRRQQATTAEIMLKYVALWA